MHWRPCFYRLLVVSYHGMCVAAAVRGELGLHGDPEFISAWKNIKTKWAYGLSVLSRIWWFYSNMFPWERSMYLLFITSTSWSPQNVHQRSGSGPRSAVVNIKEQFWSLSEFTSSRKGGNAKSSVVYRIRTALRILLILQIIHSLCFSQIIILFWRPRRRACRVVDLKLPILLGELWQFTLYSTLVL